MVVGKEEYGVQCVECVEYVEDRGFAVRIVIAVTRTHTPMRTHNTHIQPYT